MLSRLLAVLPALAPKTPVMAKEFRENGTPPSPAVRKAGLANITGIACNWLAYMKEGCTDVHQVYIQKNDTDMLVTPKFNT